FDQQLRDPWIYELQTHLDSKFQNRPQFQRKEPGQLLLFGHEDAFALSKWFHAELYPCGADGKRRLYVQVELRSHRLADTTPAHWGRLPVPVHSFPPTHD